MADPFLDFAARSNAAKRRKAAMDDAIRAATPNTLAVKPRAQASHPKAWRNTLLAPRTYWDTPELAKAREGPSAEDYLRATAGIAKRAVPGTAHALGASAKYLWDSTPGKVGSDAKWLAGLALDSAKQDPGRFLLDMTPVAGDTIGILDTLHDAAAARHAGDLETAHAIEGLAVPATLAGFLPEIGGLAAKPAIRAVRGALRGGERAASVAEEAAHAARPAYTVAPEGPFTRVERQDLFKDRQIAPEALGARTTTQLRNIAQDRARSPALRVADTSAAEAGGGGYDPSLPLPQTSLQRQAGIGRAFHIAASDDPAYKHAVFEKYGEMYPQIVEGAGAQNYDQLNEAAYHQLGKEVTSQFDRLPVSLSYHDGPGEYGSANDMMRDVTGRGNLNVFSGGEPHEFLSKIDPATGLSQNEMFRAAHDYMGHVVPGSQFGPQGEEIAYAAHSQTMSPLARLALLSETRGQNSVVNYSPKNADLIAKINTLRRQGNERSIAEQWLTGPDAGFRDASAKALEQLPTAEENSLARRELGSRFEYAPQRGVLLPPEYLDPMSAGGTPDWLRALAPGQSPTSARGVHLSRAESLPEGTDPAFYGRGHQGSEYRSTRAMGLPNRTHFYSGPEGTVRAEDPVARFAKSAHEAQLSGLYDLQDDPEGLVKLAQAYNLPGYEPTLPPVMVMNKGVEGGSAIPDIERLVRDYGYGGYLTDFGDQRAAAVYDPVKDLRQIALGHRYAEGGSVGYGASGSNGSGS